MDIGKAFSFVFEDEKWVGKVVIGSLLSLIPLIGQMFLFGYVVELIRNVTNRNPNPLPEWDDLGGKLGKGLMLFLAFLVYSLPMGLLYACAFIPTIVASGGESDAITGVATAITFVGFCLMFIYALIILVLSPAIIIRYAVTGSFGACFQFGQLLSFITSNTGNYIITLLLIWVAQGFIAGLGIIACIVGVIFTSFYAWLITGHLCGQTYREAVARGTGFRTV